MDAQGRVAGAVFRAVDAAIDMNHEDLYRLAWGIVRGSGRLQPEVEKALLAKGHPADIVQRGTAIGTVAYVASTAR